MTAPSNLIKLGFVPYSLAIRLIKEFYDIATKDAVLIYNQWECLGKDYEGILASEIVKMFKNLKI